MSTAQQEWAALREAMRELRDAISEMAAATRKLYDQAADE